MFFKSGGGVIEFLISGGGVIGFSKSNLISLYSFAEVSPLAIKSLLVIN